MRYLEPRLHLIVGPMFSGKSTELLATKERYDLAGIPSVLIKPAKDDRYSETHVATHKGSSLKANVVAKSLDVSALCEDADAVFVDEVQFFDSGIIGVFKNLRALGKVVYGAGLNMDFHGEPFKFSDGQAHIGDLLAISKPIYLTAVCMAEVNGRICGRDAEFSKLTVADPGSHIHVGGEEAYIAACFEHFHGQ